MKFGVDQDRVFPLGRYIIDSQFTPSFKTPQMLKFSQGMQISTIAAALSARRVRAVHERSMGAA
jgi:hypothetical protein